MLSIPLRRVRAGEVCCEEFLYILKAGPAGGRLRRPSSAGGGPPTTVGGVWHLPTRTLACAAQPRGLDTVCTLRRKRVDLDPLLAVLEALTSEVELAEAERSDRQAALKAADARLTRLRREREGLSHTFTGTSRTMPFIRRVPAAPSRTTSPRTCLEARPSLRS
jgi:hypothetical protein